MKKLLAIALLGLNTILGNAGDVDLENLIFVGTTVYSREIPIPLIYDCYDTNGDDREDVRAFYQLTEDGHTRLIAKFIDRNKDGIYDESERYIIVDLEKDFKEKKLKELLDKSKSFQKSSFG